MTNPPGQRHEGFTLIELAIVLVIIGVLAGSFLTTLGSRIETTRVSETQSELNEIKQAMLAYAFTNSPPYLPCPDIDGDGKEDRDGTGACNPGGTTLGDVPWATLGLGSGDAWNSRYRYWVKDAYADDSGFLTTTSSLPLGRINTRVNDVVTVLANNVVAVVLSHGKNGICGSSTDSTIGAKVLRDCPALGTGNPDEEENYDGVDLTFMSRPETSAGALTAGGVFDDLITWISEFELKAKMVEAGALPLP